MYLLPTLKLCAIDELASVTVPLLSSVANVSEEKLLFNVLHILFYSIRCAIDFFVLIPRIAKKWGGERTPYTSKAVNKK